MDEDTIIIQGKRYNVKNLHQLPEEINAFSVTSKSDDTTIGFFGELNPLSNFHPALFTYNNVQYHSSEQLIQHVKAEFFGDSGSASRILAADTPLECKKLSWNILNFSRSHWEEVTESKCAEGIRQKYIQNPALAELLVHCTGKQTNCRELDRPVLGYRCASKSQRLFGQSNVANSWPAWPHPDQNQR